MQGQRSSLTTLPENLSFDHGSTSNEPSLDSQMSWNNMQNDTNIQYLHNSEWSLGETSSGPARHQNERKWSSIHSHHHHHHHHHPVIDLEQPLNPNTNQITNGLHIPGPGQLPQDLNVRSGFEYLNDDDDCQVVEPPGGYPFSIGASTRNIPSMGSSSSSYLVEENRDGDGRRISCKRKAIEGQTSGSGSSNLFNQTENGPGPVTNNGPEQANPRLRLGGSEGSRRNFRLRINGAHHQDHSHHHHHVLPVPDPFLPEPADIGNVDRNSPNLVFNGLNGPSPPLNRRNHPSRWNGGASSSRTELYESRSISEHPMFVPSSDIIGSSSQPNFNNLAGGSGSSNNIAGSSGPGLSRAQYPRRLSEIVRRSLLTTSAGGTAEVGGPSRNHGVRSSSASTNLQEMAAASSHQRSSSRAALLERHLEGAIPIPYSLRTSLAAAGEGGRSSIMSEIRHVLDLMRRGEGLRFEDVMMLDHSVLFGMADIHDRHREMRLDVDNMSYEELLALGERIGNVCTGLNEENIVSRLKLKKYVKSKTKDQVETEPCSICREEYNDGEDLGTLECGHDFHTECIKQWLMQKNLCPICKTTGLKTT